MRSTLYSLPARIARPLLPTVLWRVRETDRALYLTFDDGPTERGTRRLLDLLGRYGAKATFFLLGANAERLPDRVEEIAANGHAIGNHSYGHIDPWTSSRRILADDMERADRVLHEVTGRPVLLARPPYGHLRPAFTNWCRQNGRQIVMWDVVTGDFDPAVTAGAAAKAVKSLARPGSIVVLHDNPESRSTMMGALEGILPHFAEAGWRFLALPDRALGSDPG